METLTNLVKGSAQTKFGAIITATCRDKEEDILDHRAEEDGHPGLSGDKT